MKIEKTHDRARKICILSQTDRECLLEIEKLRRGGLVGADRAGTW
jgi:hypothetical protein